ncbi:MAG: hypothetical protein AAFX01_09050 [Cyanobacteria bacterium J06638_28]
MTSIHSSTSNPASLPLTPNLQAPETPVKPSERHLNFWDYRIHIGWFGGIHVYSIAENYEHR